MQVDVRRQTQLDNRLFAADLQRQCMRVVRSSIGGVGDGRNQRPREDCGARAFVERLLHEHVQAAVDALDEPSVPSALATELALVARSCIGRIA